MKRGCFRLFVFLIITLLCAPFEGFAVRNSDGNANDAKQNLEEVAAQELGYNFLHAYRTALRNGWRGIKESTELNKTGECDKSIRKLSRYNLIQCKYAILFANGIFHLTHPEGELVIS